MYYYKGFNENVSTFKSSGDVPAGAPVIVCDNHTVCAAPADTAFHGVAVAGRNGAVSVQLTGYVELPYSDATPGVGYNSLVSDGNGGIKLGSNGTKALIISVDTTNAIVGAIL